ncbi:hypothetical protein JD965_13500 [Bacillus siamensis]|uniref:hypothetical protein n=1 Tax=Bacillus amyloliquefaciens group TaxID=1938374 RepID=UPI00073A71A4|nr:MULTISPECIES: hypothetical protein [Bacillus amyloliquefaciens group]ALV02203.1 hypothetical protein AVM03_07285 [Bacillus amyloliquefaciens]QQD80928.1 hypothetical protein JD965_13500 [Bacillus siamensis]
MKKIIFTLVAVITLGVTVLPESASAAWSGYQTSKKVRVYTDAITYSKSAISVDWKAQKTTSGRVYYSAMLVRTDNYSNSGVQRGNFTTGTSLKKFSLSKTRPGTYQVVVNIYSDSGERHYIGTARSAKINIKR